MEDMRAEKPLESFRQINVFLACPSDVKKEHTIIKNVIANWNSSQGQNLKAHLRLLHWSSNAPTSSSGTAQQIIDREVLDKSDLLVGVFWIQFGSPVQNESSGTAHEIRRTIARGQEVLLYFSEVSLSPKLLNSAEYTKVTEFKKEFQGKGLYFTYSRLQELTERISSDLTAAAKKVLSADDKLQDRHLWRDIKPVASHAIDMWCFSYVSGSFNLSIENKLGGKMTLSGQIRNIGIEVGTVFANIKLFDPIERVVVFDSNSCPHQDKLSLSVHDIEKDEFGNFSINAEIPTDIPSHNLDVIIETWSPGKLWGYSDKSRVSLFERVILTSAFHTH